MVWVSQVELPPEPGIDRPHIVTFSPKKINCYLCSHTGSFALILYFGPAFIPVQHLLTSVFRQKPVNAAVCRYKAENICMIKFFKDIRQKLLVEGYSGKPFNKALRYFKYAVGEIFLVVIGILIALQINNWNQNRIDKKNERIYLIGLKEEFLISKLKLEELRSVNQNNYAGAKKILAYTHSAKERPSEALFSTLLYQTFSNDIAFNPNNSLLDEMINSGNLKNLSNTELRKQLTNWISTLEDISKQERELADQRIKVLDMFRTNHTSLSAVFKQAGVYEDLELPESDKELSNLSLLDSTEFENNLLMFILASHATEIAHFEPLMQDIDNIIDLINREIELS